jgi:hypothetical protein
MTLSRWCRAFASPAAVFRTVQVVDDQVVARHRTLVVHGPYGLRIEGDVESIAALVRSLA